VCGFEIWKFQPFVIKRQKPPSIPDDIEKLEEILSERLEIIERQQPAIFGTNSECAIKLRCPFCKSEFTGHESSGCFHHEILPMNCPVCGFPSNIIRALIEKRKK
jgi:rubrerythrin